MTGSVNTVLELDRLCVPVLSVREGWLDTSGPVRPLLAAIFGWVAEQEWSRLIERTKAGLNRARREGKRLGRPPASGVTLSAARDLVLAGLPVAEAARRKGLSRSSLRRFLEDPLRGPRSRSPWVSNCRPWLKTPSR
jgi:putative DNA-invertase from lambdoid prophage Rac